MFFRCRRLWRDVCTVGGRCYVVYAGGHVTYGGGSEGHATYVLEAAKVIFRMMEVVDDMGRVLEVVEPRRA